MQSILLCLQQQINAQTSPTDTSESEDSDIEALDCRVDDTPNKISVLKEM
jgi:hypothetical protein